MGEYHDLYFKTDVLLVLTDVYKLKNIHEVLWT